MAVGDAAAAAGMGVVGSGADRRLGYEDINRTRDYLAAHMTSGGHDWSMVGNKPAVFPPSAHTHDDRYFTETEAVSRFAPASHSHGAGDLPGARALGAVRNPAAGSNDVSVSFESGSMVFRVDSTVFGVLAGGNLPILKAGDVSVPPPPDLSGKANAHEGNQNAVLAAQRVYTPLATRTNRAVWMDAGGNMGQNTSSRRYKEDVEPAEVDVEAVLSLEPVTYHRRGVDDPKRELGLIAEDVPESLKPQLVIYDVERDEGGNPVSTHRREDGIRYESTLVTMLLAVVRHQAAQIATLTARLDALEA